MRKELLKYAFGAAALAAVLSFGAISANAVNPGNPATFNATADVDILSLITISEDQNLDFGTITKPSVGATTYTVSEVTGACLAAGSDGQCLAGSAQGIYDVDGTNGELYTFGVTPGGCTGGVTLGAMTDTDTGTLDDLNVGVGGTLTVDSTDADGPQTCTYDVTAQY